MLLGSEVNIPNALTLSRIFIVPLLVVVLLTAALLVLPLSAPTTRSRGARGRDAAVATVLSVLLFDKSDEGNFELLSAMGLILVVVTVALILVGFRLVGRDFLLRRTAT